MSIQVHPKSEWKKARDFVRFITQDPRIQLLKYRRATLKKCFFESQNGLEVKAPSALVLPIDVLKAVRPWYPLVELASRSNNWMITTGALFAPGMLHADADPNLFRLKGTQTHKPADQTDLKRPGATKIDLTKQQDSKTKSSLPSISKKVDPDSKKDMVLGNLLKIPIGTGGLCIPPWSFARNGDTYHDSSRGIIVILNRIHPAVKADTRKLLEPLLKVAQSNRAYVILHELVHAGLFDNDKAPGHCHSALFALDKYFKTNISKNACTLEKKQRKKAGSYKGRRPTTGGGLRGGGIDPSGRQPILGSNQGLDDLMEYARWE